VQALDATPVARVDDPFRLPDPLRFVPVGVFLCPLGLTKILLVVVPQVIPIVVFSGEWVVLFSSAFGVPANECFLLLLGGVNMPVMPFQISWSSKGDSTTSSVKTTLI
jgi:hypothetical protein